MLNRDPRRAWSITVKSKVTRTPPVELADAVARLGRRIRAERIRCGLSQQDLADRMGVARRSIVRLEKGKLGTSMGMYAGALWALDLLGPLGEVADPDLDEEAELLDSMARRNPPRAP